MHKTLKGNSNRGLSFNKQAPLIYKIPPNFLIFSLFNLLIINEPLIIIIRYLILVY